MEKLPDDKKMFEVMDEVFRKHPVGVPVSCRKHYSRAIELVRLGFLKEGLFGTFRGIKNKQEEAEQLLKDYEKEHETSV